MRLSVRCRRVCPGEEKRILRKSAFCIRRVTEKRILQPTPHGKAHSVLVSVAKLRFSVRVSRKSALCDPQTNQTAPYREALGCKVRFLVPQLSQTVPFREGDVRRMRLSVKRQAQNALFREVPTPECAFP